MLRPDQDLQSLQRRTLSNWLSSAALCGWQACCLTGPYSNASNSLLWQDKTCPIRLESSNKVNSLETLTCCTCCQVEVLWQCAEAKLEGSISLKRQNGPVPLYAAPWKSEVSCGPLTGAGGTNVISLQVTKYQCR